MMSRTADTTIKYSPLGPEPGSMCTRRPRMLFITVLGGAFLLILYLAFDAQMSASVPSLDFLEAKKTRVNASRASLGANNETNNGISGSNNANDSSSTDEQFDSVSKINSNSSVETSAAVQVVRRTPAQPTAGGEMPATRSSKSSFVQNRTRITEMNSTQTLDITPVTHLSTTTEELSTIPPGISSTAPTTADPPESEILQRPVPELLNTTDIYKDYAIFTSKCRIRDYDFNDSKVLKEYFSGEIAHCREDALPFVFYPDMKLTEGHSCIGFNATISSTLYNVTEKGWKCIFKELVRGERHEVVDRHFDYGEEGQLVIGGCPPYEFLWVDCEIEGSNYNYSQPLLLPLVKPVPKNVRHNNLGKKPLNVLVVGMDSVSRLNAHRQFPGTLKFLQSKKNLVELFGYNKIGVNSAPNQLPLLSGVQYSRKSLEARVTDHYFDNETRFLWDDFESRGYRTMFYEEQWKYGLFVYPKSNGFKDAPTTYWPRPAFQAVDWSDLKKNNYEWCIGPDFPAKHYLEYTLNTFRMLGSDRPMFSYSWLSEIAHNDVNGGIRADGYFLNFFRDMERFGLLDTTAVFFISDHGFRFGYFRQTELGRYEDMLPYGFILMPDSYYEQYPEALKNLRANSRRLVTVYDLHVTMLELADAWDEDRTVRTPNGFSLFSNIIPEDRTCLDAGIDFQFCSCFDPHQYDTNSTLAAQVATFILDTANEILRNKSATDKCHEWKLATVDTFTQLAQGKHWTKYFKISLTTEPTAQFEAAVEFHSNNTWTLLSNIDRVDWFSSHAECVKSTDYERYCYCKSGSSSSHSE